MTEPTPAEPTPAGPTPEELAWRRQRADKATRGALAGILGLEAVIVLLMPRAIAQTSAGLGVTKTVLLIVLAVLMIMGAGMLRRTWGIAAGSILQVFFLLSAVLLPASLIASVLMAGIWLYLLNLRNQLAGTPGGIRMLVS
jgi:hypothetical protein